MNRLLRGAAFLTLRLLAICLIGSILMSALFAAGFTFADSTTVWPYLGLLVFVVASFFAIGFCVDYIEDRVQRWLPDV